MNSVPVRHVRTALALLTALLTALALTAPAHAEVDGEPDDPLWEHQWGPQQIRADDAWPTSTGAGTTIAIVDSGVDLHHEDLSGNVVIGNTFIDGCRSDEDRRGNDDCQRDGDWTDGEDDGHPHGTHVAGIAGAVTDNGTGIAGVAPDTTLLPVKVLDSSGTGTYEDVADGIRWAVDEGADVVNLSLGLPPGGQVLSMSGVMSEVVEAIEYAHANGVLVVAAAGNEAFPLCDDPAWSEGVICVGATDRRELPSIYSNWPNKPDILGVSAPGGSLILVVCGEGVLSTVPAGEGIDSCDYPSNQAYDEYDGTSMSAPHVSGTGALLLAVGCDREESIDLITGTARAPYDGSRGTWDPRYGYGIVDAAEAVNAAATGCADHDPTGATGSSTGGQDDGDEDEDRCGPPEDRGPSEDRGNEDNDRGADRERGSENCGGPDRDGGRDAKSTEEDDGSDDVDGEEDEEDEDGSAGPFSTWLGRTLLVLQGLSR